MFDSGPFVIMNEFSFIVETLVTKMLTRCISCVCLEPIESCIVSIHHTAGTTNRTEIIHSLSSGFCTSFPG